MDDGSGEDATWEVATVRDEVYLSVERALHLLYALPDLGEVLVRKHLIDTHIVVAPRKMLCRSGFHPGSRGTGDGIDGHVAVEEMHGGGGQESQLDAGGKTARIGYVARMTDSLPVDFGKTIDEVMGIGGRCRSADNLFRFPAEVLGKVDNPDTIGNGMLFHECLALAMTETEEHYIDIVERHRRRELQVGIAIEPFVHIGDVIAGVALRIGKDQFHVGMIDQQPYQFTASISGSS